MELGGGAGRFSILLAKYAKELVVLDLSYAIFINEAIGLKNVTFVRADLNAKVLKRNFDLVFCRGVLQHTISPEESIKTLFNHSNLGGLVIFDIYSRSSLIVEARNWQNLYRLLFKPIPRKFIEDFVYLHGNKMYAVHSFFNSLRRKYFIFRQFCKLISPLYPYLDVDPMYPGFTKKAKAKVYGSLVLDILTSKYYNKRNFKEVVQILAEIGQYPYSFNEARCMIRVKKRNHKPFNPLVGKDGVFEKDT